MHKLWRGSANRFAYLLVFLKIWIFICVMTDHVRPLVGWSMCWFIGLSVGLSYFCRKAEPLYNHIRVKKKQKNSFAGVGGGQDTPLLAHSLHQNRFKASGLPGLAFRYTARVFQRLFPVAVFSVAATT